MKYFELTCVCEVVEQNDASYKGCYEKQELTMIVDTDCTIVVSARSYRMHVIVLTAVPHPRTMTSFKVNSSYCNDSDNTHWS